MERREYNGWTNYETWVVALWMDNEPGSADYWQERAGEALDQADGDKDDAACALADEIKEQHEEMAPKVEGVFADLQNAALSEVNWREIAEHAVEAAAEEREDDAKEAA